MWNREDILKNASVFAHTMKVSGVQTLRLFYSYFFQNIIFWCERVSKGHQPLHFWMNYPFNIMLYDFCILLSSFLRFNYRERSSPEQTASIQASLMIKLLILQEKVGVQWIFTTIKSSQPYWSGACNKMPTLRALASSLWLLIMAERLLSCVRPAVVTAVPVRSSACCDHLAE